MSGEPTVLVLTPVKNAAPFLPRYFELLSSLDYPASRTSLGFLVGDSTDGSDDALASRLPELRINYRRAALLRRDHPVRFEGPRWQPAVQLVRRAEIAKSRNVLLSSCLRDEEWVLWLDSDLADYPSDLLRTLLSSGKEIVTASCLRERGQRSFDLNTFVLKSRSPLARAWMRLRHTRHGLLQPPAHIGRRYLDEFRGQALVEVDSVGGTVLLVRADLHREGLNFPAFPYHGHIETEGFALIARKLGYSCWGMPDLVVRHANA